MLYKGGNVYLDPKQRKSHLENLYQNSKYSSGSFWRLLWFPNKTYMLYFQKVKVMHVMSLNHKPQQLKQSCIVNAGSWMLSD